MASVTASVGNHSFSGSVTGTFGSNIAAGDTVVVIGRTQGGTASTAGTVSDSAAGTWAAPEQIDTFLSGAESYQCFVYFNHPGGVAAVTFAHPSATTTTIAAWRITSTGALEVVDVTFTYTIPSSGADALATPSQTMATSEGILLSSALDAGGDGPGIATAGTGFTGAPGDYIFGYQHAEYRALSTPGSYQSTYDISTGGVDFAAVSILLQAEAGGGGGISLAWLRA